MCRDYNNLLPSEVSTQCKNCGRKIKAKGNESATLGNDGTFVNKHVNYFFEDSNEWCLEKLISYNASNDNKYPQSYTLQLNNDNRITYKITFSDDNICFA
jgi:hypothetical protein